MENSRGHGDLAGMALWQNRFNSRRLTSIFECIKKPEIIRA